VIHLLAYRPFLDPMPIYNWWYALLIPLCLLFSIVYKAVKCESVADVPKAALSITLWIVVAMAAAGAALALLDRFA
jgi:hypothetical protein